NNRAITQLEIFTREYQVYPFTGFDMYLRLHTGKLLYLFSVNASCVYHVTCMHHSLLATEPISHGDAYHLAFFLKKGDGLRIVCNGCSILGSGGDERERQASIIRLC